MVESFRKSLQTAGKTIDIKVFPRVGHAVLNDSNPTYRADDAKSAWAAIDEFLSKNLRGH